MGREAQINWQDSDYICQLRMLFLLTRNKPDQNGSHCADNILDFLKFDTDVIEGCL